MSCGQSVGKFILGKEKHRGRNHNGVSGGICSHEHKVGVVVFS